MKVGDQVEICGQLAIDDERIGVIECFMAGVVVVRFADGWSRYYRPEELRVVEETRAEGARA